MEFIVGTYGLLLGAVFVFCFGVVVGSFLNVVALRYNTGHSLGGRSACPSCTRALEWFELVPVISYFALRGRCRTCGSVLSIQYPLVELTTGLLFAALFVKSASLWVFFFGLLMIGIYMVIGIYDIGNTIVPDGLSYTAALLAFIALFVMTTPLGLAVPSLWDIAAGPIIALPLFLIWFLSGGRGMGLGDSKLALSIGWLLGLSSGGAALLVAFWSGALFGLGFIAWSWFKRQRGKNRLSRVVNQPTMKSEIAFAPFLLISLGIVFFFDIDIVTLIVWNF